MTWEKARKKATSGRDIWLGPSAARVMPAWEPVILMLAPEMIAKLRSVRYYGGLPLDARTVTDEVIKQEGK